MAASGGRWKVCQWLRNGEALPRLHVQCVVPLARILCHAGPLERVRGNFWAAKNVMK